MIKVQKCMLFQESKFHYTNQCKAVHNAQVIYIYKHNLKIKLKVS
jgi:hypothetical protein